MDALFLFAMLVAVLGALTMVKHLDQRFNDGRRKTYKLGFPSNMDAERVAAWIRSISGTLRGRPSSLFGVPTITFEMWSDNRGITHLVKVPWEHADYIIAQLRSLVAGLRAVPETDVPVAKWTRAVEVALTHKSRQLRIYNAADMSASLLASVQPLAEGEKMIMQWVVTPAIPQHKPIYNVSRSHEMNMAMLLRENMASRDEINDRREKLEEPNVLAVLRVAAVANTAQRADHLIHRVRASLASARGPSTHFVKRFVTKKGLQKRIDTAAGSVVFPVQLSAPELSALVAWPVGNPFVSGLPPTMSRHLPANETIARVGRVLGSSNMPGSERPIAVTYEEARKHVHVAGPTGVGKTVLLSNMMKQDIEQGYGVVLIENKGDLFHAAMNFIPKERMKDVVVLDVNDVHRPVGFNILNQGNPRVIVDELVLLFDQLYRNSAGVWTRSILYHGLRTLILHPELTFIDLGPLLVPMSTEESDWRDELLRSAKDRELRNFWQRFINQPRSAQDRVTQPVMDRIWQLNARPELRNIIGQSKSSFQMEDVVRDGKILLVNLSGIARETASLTGSLLMNTLWHAVKTVRPARPMYLYLDEFQDFLTLPIDPEDMLAKARGYGLGMTLAHQHLAQLSPEMRQAVMANARTKVMFQASADDARAMAREFGNSVTENDFMNLAKFEAIARISTGDGVSAPVTLATHEPARGYGFASSIRTVSRNTYGRPAGEVEIEIDRRRTASNVQKPKRGRPKLGGDGWTQ